MAESRHGGGAAPPNHHRKPEKLTLRILLERHGLSQYDAFFEQAGYIYFDGSSPLTDLQVERMLADVEKKCGIQFLPDVRVKLWKVLRYQWFRTAGCLKPFIGVKNVPRLFLPKRDYRQVDSMVKFSEIDPDRQRQILRKQRVVESTGRGPGIQTMQFDVWRRQTDIMYELMDLSRCVQEWQKKNPRTMLKEDSREEVLKMRIRNLLDRTVAALEQKRQTIARRRRVAHVLVFAMLVFGSLCVLMIITAYIRFRDSPSEIQFEFIGRSRQFVAATNFFLTTSIIFSIFHRYQQDPHIRQLQRAALSGERLMEQISDFRIETEDLRMVVFEKPQQDSFVGRAVGFVKGKAKEASVWDPIQGTRRRKKKKKKKDPALALWAPMAHKHDGALSVQAIRKGIEESYKRLPPPESAIRRPGGDRMLTFEKRLGGVHPNELVIKSSMAQLDVPSLPPAPEELPPEGSAPPPSGSQLRDAAITDQRTAGIGVNGISGFSSDESGSDGA